MCSEISLLKPELILAGGSMFVLLTGVYMKNQALAIATSIRLSSLILLGSLISLVFLPHISQNIFNGLYRFDLFGIFVKAVLIFSGAITLIISSDYIEDKTNKFGFEYPILVLLSVLGMLIMVSANDLLTLYLGLELQSLSAYVLAAIKREDKNATEAAIKYFVLGALASGILLYGATLIYGYLGSTNFTNIALTLHGHAALSQGVIVGLVFVLIGFSFKLSAAPFHMWTPDVYEGVPTPVTAYFAIVPKLAAMALFIRLLVGGPFAGYANQWEQIVIAVSVISMVVGAFGGIWQSNIRRLLAYSSISNMGYALLGVVANSTDGIQATLVYFVIYIITSIALFAILLSLKSNQKLIEKIDDFKGLASRHPIVALVLSLLLFSMIGLPFPPFPGFFAKFFVFSAAINSGFYAVAVIGMITSIVAAYYYLRIIKIMYFDKADEHVRISLSAGKISLFVIFMISFLSLAIFIMPSTLLDPAYAAAFSLFK